MYDGSNAFDYYLINSPIHKLNLFYKIISIIIVGGCLIVADSIIDMIVINFFIFVIMVWSDISIRVCFSSLRMFKFIILVIFLMLSFIYLNVFVGILWSLKFIDIILYLSIIAMTTSFYSILVGIYKFLSPLTVFVDVSEFVLKLVMVIKFLSIMYDEDARIRKSKKLRGVRFEDMGLIDKIDFFVNELGSLWDLSLMKLDRLKDNIYVKKYGISKYRCNYRLNKWRKTDTILLVINVMVMIIVAIY